MPKARSSSALRSTKRAGLALAQQHQRAVDEVELLLGLLVVALGFLRQIVDALLQAVEVGEHQLGLDGLDVGKRGDLALDMGDVAILEATHHMRDRVDLADRGEELVAEALALGCAAHQARDVDEGQPGRNDLRRFRDFGQLVEPGVGHRDFADIRLDGAERIVGRLRRRGLRQCVEQRRLADIGQSDDTAFESHNILYPFSSCPRLARASTSFLFAEAKTWMAGTSPAMTMENQLCCSPLFSFSKNPLPCITRCTLFWNEASWPAASRPALSATASHSAVTHAPSSLAKSESTW